ncbi:hypothetical protein BX666DRAFT_2026206 [Dichotomocladium elegans]|nr:hypothetical protein BX666DRAFT_2026206 [Dichotomocladium elegans]
MGVLAIFRTEELENVNSEKEQKERKGVQNLLSFMAHQVLELIAYITSLSQAGHEEISGRYVAVDPGRQDLMYCVHEDSTNIAARQFRVQQPEVAFAEHRLSEDRSRTLVLDDFRRILRVRSEVSEVLQEFYSHAMTDHVPRAFLFQTFRLSAYFNKQLSDIKLAQDFKEKFGITAVFRFRELVSAYGSIP